MDHEHIVAGLKNYCVGKYFPSWKDYRSMVPRVRHYVKEGWSLSEAIELAVEDWVAEMCFKYPDRG